MIVILASSFEIANGIDRLAQVLAEDAFSVRQSTQTAPRCRAEWLTGFHSRASRSVPLSYVVTFPPCVSLEAAYAQARSVPLSCPKGGVLTEQVGSTLTTFADSWIEGEIGVRRIGVRNTFTFNLTAVDPDTTTLSPLAQTNMSYIVNLNVPPFSVTGLTGGTAGKLDALVTADVSLGFTGKLFFEMASGVWITKHFQIVTRATAAAVTGGSGAENTNPASGSLIIDPEDFDLVTNNKVWLEVL
jgi:hypothetical protein